MNQPDKNNRYKAQQHHKKGFIGNSLQSSNYISPRRFPNETDRVLSKSALDQATVFAKATKKISGRSSLVQKRMMPIIGPKKVSSRNLRSQIEIYDSRDRN